MFVSSETGLKPRDCAQVIRAQYWRCSVHDAVAVGAEQHEVTETRDAVGQESRKWQKVMDLYEPLPAISIFALKIKGTVLAKDSAMRRPKQANLGLADLAISVDAVMSHQAPFGLVCSHPA